MGVLELRKKWLESIKTVDERFLRIVDALYENYEKQEMDSYDKLPNDVKRLIEKGLEDIKQGRVYSHNEVMDEFKKKYNII
jgi:predicted transcriptional regulator